MTEAILPGKKGVLSELLRISMKNPLNALKRHLRGKEVFR
jgi:hypothetical protein